jgi:hypothetical protein
MMKFRGMGRRIIATLAALFALVVAGSGCGSDDSGTSGNREFQGDPALDGLKPGDCLKPPTRYRRSARRTRSASSVSRSSRRTTRRPQWLLVLDRVLQRP